MPDEALAASKGADNANYAEAAAMTPNMAVSRANAGIQYDPVSGVYRLNDAGRYLVHWSMLVSPVRACEAGDVVIALESADGQMRHALSGTNLTPLHPVGLVVGFAVVDAAAGDTLVLRNRSAYDVHLACAAGTKANVSANFSIIRLA